MRFAKSLNHFIVLNSKVFIKNGIEWRRVSSVAGFGKYIPSVRGFHSSRIHIDVGSKDCLLSDK